MPTNFRHLEHIYINSDGNLIVIFPDVDTSGAPRLFENPARHERIHSTYGPYDPSYASIPPNPSYASTPSGFSSTCPPLRNAAPSDREITDSISEAYLERYLPDLLQYTNPASPDTSPPARPNTPRTSTDPYPSAQSSLSSSDLAHEPQAHAYPEGRIASSSMPAAAPEEIAGVIRFHGRVPRQSGQLSRLRIDIVFE